MRVSVLLFLCCVVTTATAPAHAFELVNTYTVVNTGGFTEMDGTRTPIRLQPVDREVTILQANAKRTLLFSIEGSEIVLFRLTDGLSSLEWDSDGTGLLDKADVLAISNKNSLAEIPAWGARLDWPGLGPATMVVFAPTTGAYYGFLISSKNGTRFVRQMEFRPSGGPANRPR